MLPKKACSHGLVLIFFSNLYVGCIGNDIDVGTNFDGSLNIIDVVNTSENLWVYYQTYLNGFVMSQGDNMFTVTTTCIYNRLRGVSDKDYNFTKYQYSQDAWSADNYTGTFIYSNETDKKKPPEAMYVDLEGERKADEIWTLKYTDPDNHTCNVYEITSVGNVVTKGGPMCEMHIKDSQVQKGPPTNCLNFYKQKCEGKTYQPYQPYCQGKGMEDMVIVRK
uniref:Lipocalin n=1 Tax=Rhipicephalus zambeziensis TaxID=60191 RepID=A0A224YHI3_9ACAR